MEWNFERHESGRECVKQGNYMFIFQNEDHTSWLQKSPQELKLCIGRRFASLEEKLKILNQHAKRNVGPEGPTSSFPRRWCRSRRTDSELFACIFCLYYVTQHSSSGRHSRRHLAILKLISSQKIWQHPPTSMDLNFKCFWEWLDFNSKSVVFCTNLKWKDFTLF